MENLERVFELKKGTKIPVKDSYIQSYPHLLKYFAGIRMLDSSHVAIGAHMVYGWMPTIVHLDKRGSDPDKVVGILQAVKDDKAELTIDALNTLKQYINNSVVGASKLLHFISPEQYPIWDSKIFQFTHNKKKPQQYLVNNPGTYLKYRNQMLALKHHAAFPEFHASVNQELGYSVSGLRALELMMFLNRNR